MISKLPKASKIINNFAVNHNALFRKISILSSTPLQYFSSLKSSHSQVSSSNPSLPTAQRIESSASVLELLSLNTTKISSSPLISQFMQKLCTLLTDFLLQISVVASRSEFQSKLQTPSRQTYEKVLKLLSTFLYHLRYYSSLQLKSNSSDLLIYQLFFKQMKDIYIGYRLYGLEIRMTMIAAALPKGMGFGVQARAISLLHYHSTISRASGQQLKYSLLGYFLMYKKYFSSKEKLNKDIQSKNKEQKKNFDIGLHFDPLPFLIMLSCSNQRETRNIVQSSLQSTAIQSLNNFSSVVENYLQIQQVLQIYKDKILKKQKKFYQSSQACQIFCFSQHFSSQQKVQIVNKILEIFPCPLSSNSSSNHPQGVPIIPQMKFLLTADLFINLTNKEQKQTLGNWKNFKFLQNLFQYLYTILETVENDMGIWVRGQGVHDLAIGKENGKEFGKKQGGKEQIKLIKLWKIYQQIVKNFVQKTNYVKNSQKFLLALLKKIINYTQAHIKDSKSKQAKRLLQKIRTEIRNYEHSIISILTDMPIQIFQKYYKSLSNQKRQEARKMLQNLVKLCVQNIANTEYVTEHSFHPNASINRNMNMRAGVNLKGKQKINKQLGQELKQKYLEKQYLRINRQYVYHHNFMKRFVKFAKVKRNYIVDYKKWVSYFKILINQQANQQQKPMIKYNHRFWNIYFFLASTQDKKLASLIPINQISQNLINRKKQLKSLESSLDPKTRSSPQSPFYILSLQFQVELLKLHAVLHLLNKQSTLATLFPAQCPITSSNIMTIFEQWIKPYTPIISQNEKGSLQRHKPQLLKSIQVPSKPSHEQIQNPSISQQIVPQKCANFKNYFRLIFSEMQCFYQFNLISVILQSPHVENQLLYWKIQVESNFIPYFMCYLAMMVTDQKEFFMHKYPLMKIIPKMDTTGLFGHIEHIKKMDIQTELQMECIGVLLKEMNCVGNSGKEIFQQFVQKHRKFQQTGILKTSRNLALLDTFTKKQKPLFNQSESSLIQISQKKSLQPPKKIKISQKDGSYLRQKIVPDLSSPLGQFSCKIHNDQFLKTFRFIFKTLIQNTPEAQFSKTSGRRFCYAIEFLYEIVLMEYRTLQKQYEIQQQNLSFKHAENKDNSNKGKKKFVQNQGIFGGILDIFSFIVDRYVQPSIRNVILDTVSKYDNGSNVTVYSNLITMYRLGLIPLSQSPSLIQSSQKSSFQKNYFTQQKLFSLIKQRKIGNHNHNNFLYASNSNRYKNQFDLLLFAVYHIDKQNLKDLQNILNNCLEQHTDIDGKIVNEILTKKFGQEWRNGIQAVSKIGQRIQENHQLSKKFQRNNQYTMEDIKKSQTREIKKNSKSVYKPFLKTKTINQQNQKQSSRHPPSKKIIKDPQQ